MRVRPNRERGTGILNNPLYDGSVVYGMMEFRRNPGTGKQVGRVRKDGPLLAPEAIAAAVGEAARSCSGRGRAPRPKRVRRAKAEAERAIANMLKAIEDGMYTPSMKDRMLAGQAALHSLANRTYDCPPQV